MKVNGLTTWLQTNVELIWHLKICSQFDVPLTRLFLFLELWRAAAFWSRSSGTTQHALHAVGVAAKRGTSVAPVKRQAVSKPPFSRIPSSGTYRYLRACGTDSWVWVPKQRPASCGPERRKSEQVQVGAVFAAIRPLYKIQSGKKTILMWVHRVCVSANLTRGPFLCACHHYWRWTGPPFCTSLSTGVSTTLFVFVIFPNFLSISPHF